MRFSQKYYYIRICWHAPAEGKPCGNEIVMEAKVKTCPSLQNNSIKIFLSLRMTIKDFKPR